VKDLIIFLIELKTSTAMTFQYLLNDNFAEFEKLTEMIPSVGSQFDESQDDLMLLSASVPEFSLDADCIACDKSEDSRDRSGSGLSAITQGSYKDYSANSTQDGTQNDHGSEGSEKQFSAKAFSCFISETSQVQKNSDLELGLFTLDTQLPDQDCPEINEQAAAVSRSTRLGPCSKMQIELIRQNEFVSTISKLIDQQPLRLSDVDSLDSEQVILLTNFTKMLFNVVLDPEQDMVSQLGELNMVIKSTPEKKKRNEERIKFTFKRANKLLLKRFVQLKQLESLSEEKTQKLFVEHFFSQESSLSNQEFLRLVELIFKPRNIYRRELKDLFRYQQYTEEFVFTLESLLYDEYLKKRRTKILGLCDQIKEELYYHNDKSNASVLEKIMKRMPWSAHEARRGLDLMLEIISAN